MTDFIFDLIRNYHTLNDRQYDNVTRLIGVSKNFLKKKSLKSPPDINITEPERLFVIESGHQPNFLPHAAMWKKAFFLDRLYKSVEDSGAIPIAFFGFADQNISTARVLSKNQIPDLNKNGFTKIGFKIKNEKKSRSFTYVEKPPFEQWENEINRIRKHYLNISEKTKFNDENIKNQWNQILDILWTSYERADNFPELNSLIFARICNELFGINLFFFLYSDMHNECLFLEESKKILRDLHHFNQIYNQVIAHGGLDIPPVQPNHLPFWYECECGVKLDLFLDDANICKTTCPFCQKENSLVLEYDFENLEEYYNKMDFNAVSRNVIMAQGLGDTIFVSGTGGSSVYGQISDRISHEIGFHLPVIVAWQSKDRYLGMMQKVVLRDLMKTFSLSPEDLSKGLLKEKIERKFEEISVNLQDSIERDCQQEIKYLKGLQISMKNLSVFAKNFFSTTPSFVDILANYQSDIILKIWRQALDTKAFQEHGYMYLIQADVNYPGIFFPELEPAIFPKMYDAINAIGV